MAGLFGAAAQSQSVARPIRVMIVDDSIVIRGLLSRWLEGDDEIEVVAAHRTGRLAVDNILKSDPDLVVLDIEMPDMDGMTALPLLLKAKPGLVVVMASTLTRRNAEISLRALSLGASDYIPKPESNREVTTSVDFRRELIDKVKSWGRRALSGATKGPSGRQMTALTRNTARTVETAAPPTRMTKSAGGATRGYSMTPPRILVIGSSTGGPQALTHLFGEIGSAISRVPVVVVQHMPAMFTTILAEHIAKAAGRAAAEAVDGEILRPGQVYVAPGGKHLVFQERAGQTAAKLTEDAPVNFCRPAVDPMFQSACKIYGASTLALVLTGMGSDGTEGVRELGAVGASIIAQDEASSVVWGMPGAAAQTGQCSEILPLNAIGSKVVRLLTGGRS